MGGFGDDVKLFERNQRGARLSRQGEAFRRYAERILEEAGFEVAAVEILPDERKDIETRLRWASEEGFRLVVTSARSRSIVTLV